MTSVFRSWLFSFRQHQHDTSATRAIFFPPGALLCAALFLGLSAGATYGQEDENPLAEQSWALIVTTDGSAPVARHEASAVVAEGQLFLIGGRGLKSVDRYDSESNTWTSLSQTPFGMHHLQPVYWRQKIYVVGGFVCCYPNEPSLSDVHIYDPQTDMWTIGDPIPDARRRGSAAAVLHNDKIYVIGGNTLGHNGGAVPWFDEYDPATGTWTELPDAPHSRDHFTAAMVGNVLVAAGGRRSTQPDPFINTVAAVDLYNFERGEWQAAAAIPTERAGTMTVTYGTEAIVIGGEIADQSTALADVEAFDVTTGQWRELPALQLGRHSGGAAAIGAVLHVVAGNLDKGGGNETTSHETLTLNPVALDPEPTTTQDNSISVGSGMLDLHALSVLLLWVLWLKMRYGRMRITCLR